MAFVKAIEADSLAPGKATIVRANHREYALFNVDGEYYCLDNECPHRDGPLGEGDVEGDVVTCPYHAWQVNIKTGEVQHAFRACVATHPTKVEEGAVWIDV